MAENLNIQLSDKGIIPTDEVLFSIIGDKMNLWHVLMNTVKDKYPDSTGSWNYYNDGKRWLFKMTRKKKTMFWTTVFEDTFRITFYFGDKAEPLIFSSDLSVTIKNDFKTSRRYGLIRAITVIVNEQSDIDTVLRLISIKLKIK
ncbi:MAG TPA: DUF3788 family protein [Bacteroidales bacterium]